MKEGAANEGQHGFTLIELIIVVSIIAIIVAIAFPMAVQYRSHGQISAVHTECRNLYPKFELYYEENVAYPSAVSLTDYTPLVIHENMNQYLLNEQADAYGSPDDMGIDQEFWMQFTVAASPSVQFVVANSDDSPLAPGSRLSGAFRFKDGIIQY